jgi:uroporphyrinogen III methyltransferase/synthase
VVVTFTSSSTVSGFLDGLAAGAMEGLRKCTLASIGPITSEDLVRRGFPPRIIPRQFTIPALIEAIRSHFAG